MLAPGREIRPADIPPEVSGAGTALVPAFAADALPRAVGEGESTLRPQLEFIFRTLVEMRTSSRNSVAVPRLPNGSEPSG